MRSFTYIDDIIESIYRLIKTKNDDSEKYSIFNIGGDNAIDLMDYISIIEDELSIKGKYNFLPIQPGDLEKTESETLSLIKKINFSPTTDIKKGIKEFIKWHLDYYST